MFQPERIAEGDAGQFLAAPFAPTSKHRLPSRSKIKSMRRPKAMRRRVNLAIIHAKESKAAGGRGGPLPGANLPLLRERSADSCPLVCDLPACRAQCPLHVDTGHRPNVSKAQIAVIARQPTSGRPRKPALRLLAWATSPWLVRSQHITSGFDEFSCWAAWCQRVRHERDPENNDPWNTNRSRHDPRRAPA